MTKNRKLALHGEGYWCWPVRHLRKKGKRAAARRERQASRLLAKKDRP